MVSGRVWEAETNSRNRALCPGDRSLEEYHSACVFKGAGEDDPLGEQQQASKGAKAWAVGGEPTEGRQGAMVPVAAICWIWTQWHEECDTYIISSNA